MRRLCELSAGAVALLVLSASGRTEVGQADKSFRLGKFTAFRVAGRHGYIDRTGRFALDFSDRDGLPGKYDHLCSFSEGLAAVALRMKPDEDRKPLKWGFIDKTGKEVIPARFPYAADFHEGLAAVNVGGRVDLSCYYPLGTPVVDKDGRPFWYRIVSGKWGYIDRKGQFVIRSKFTGAGPFRNGVAKVEMGEKVGHIDRMGKRVAAPPARATAETPDELTAFGQNGRWGYRNRKGKVAIKPQFAAAGRLRDGIARVNVGGVLRWGRVRRGAWRFIDKTGKFISPWKFDIAFAFREGLAAVSIGPKWGLRDANGRVVHAPQFDTLAREFVEGMARVERHGWWGFLDESGRLAIEPRFEWVKAFSEGLAPAETKQKCGFIDKTGKFVISPRFETAEPFSEGLAAVRVGRKHGFVDRSGALVIAPQFEPPQENLWANDGWGRFPSV